MRRHLATLHRYRAVDPYCAWLWPEDARMAHSVIDHTYGLAPAEVPGAYTQACNRLEQHTAMIEQWLEENA